jgi:hypothetical protein
MWEDFVRGNWPAAAAPRAQLDTVEPAATDIGSRAERKHAAPSIMASPVASRPVKAAFASGAAFVRDMLLPSAPVAGGTSRASHARPLRATPAHSAAAGH